MSNLTRLPHGLKAGKLNCQVVIETPKGSRAKYAYEPEGRAFKLKRLLPDGMAFPLDFGFVPSTKGQDGDPLDILVLNDEPLAMGALAEVRLIGVVEAEQTQKGKTVRNDRILAVTKASFLYEAINAIDDLGQAFVRNLTQFWVNYDALRGVGFKVLGVRDADRAAALIRKAEI